MQARFVELIASGETMRGAAIELDRSERTLRRWKSATTIKAAIRDRLAEALARARAILSAGAGEAAAALVGMAGGTVAAEAARCAAARAVLENATKLGEIAAIEERLAEVESRLGPGRGRL
ncbi:MAG: hypothetical protein JXP73_03280 [Deltaproteobacteria bacterium]|nr:hypothetical protein [Deltaproteobacteria bacterium]